MKTSPVNPGKTLLVTGAAGILFASAGFGGYLYLILHRENALLRENIEGAERSARLIKDDFWRLTKENADLAETLRAEQEKNGVFEDQIRTISGTVGTLQKLSATDKELLKKYSKVYFLSENYVPARLSPLDSTYLYNKDSTQYIHTDVLPFLQNMIESAIRENVQLEVVSAFRSFYDQISVKSGYRVIYGAGSANQFSADQGYSEHQLGTTVDFTTPEANGIFAKFEGASAYQWLADRAHQFGFILSYPHDNSYYQSEPWHWRFVGVALATRLHNDGKYFYELSQREIDEYLIQIFD